MKELNLPIIKGAPPATKWLPMDDYLKFIILNLKYTLDKKTIRRRKKLEAVNVPFSLKGG